MIKENLEIVENKIQMACERAGRARDEVSLIAVSKTKPMSMIEEAMEMGIVKFGENKPQELKEKHDALPRHLQWHMIGHLQRNKVKYVITRSCLIHSVDSLRLAQTIDQEARKAGIVMPVLVEVNVAGEDSKFGIKPEETLEFIQKLSTLPGLSVQGLMTIAPFVENPQDNRIIFKKLRNLYVDIKSKNIDNVSMCELSMGMTGDYEVAIEEGATMVRVGTGIFGHRDYDMDK